MNPSSTAYAQVKSKIPAHQQMVYMCVLNSFAGYTRAEIASTLHWSINRVCPRVKELLDCGLLYENGLKTCSVTGSTAGVLKAVPYEKWREYQERKQTQGELFSPKD